MIPVITMSKIGIITQCRMSSSRLSNKLLSKLKAKQY